MTNVGCEMLRFAIIRQAVEDYESALRRRDDGKCAALERWFLSDWGELLSDDAGELIIAKCKNRVCAEKGR